MKANEIRQKRAVISLTIQWSELERGWIIRVERCDGRSTDYAYLELMTSDMPRIFANVGDALVACASLGFFHVWCHTEGWLA